MVYPDKKMLSGHADNNLSKFQLISAQDWQTVINCFQCESIVLAGKQQPSKIKLIYIGNYEDSNIYTLR